MKRKRDISVSSALSPVKAWSQLLHSFFNDSQLCNIELLFSNKSCNCSLFSHFTQSHLNPAGGYSFLLERKGEKKLLLPHFPLIFSQHPNNHYWQIQGVFLLCSCMQKCFHVSLRGTEWEIPSDKNQGRKGNLCLTHSL